MKLKHAFLMFAVVAVFAVNAHADTMDFFVQSGSNTWAWTLAQSPTPDITYPNAFEFLSVPVSMNGAAAIPYFFEFTDSGAPGGGGWMGFQCQQFLTCNWDIIEGFTFGANLFTGSAASPTLTAGTYTSTMSFPYFSPDSYPTLTATAVPEPSSLALVGLGFCGLLVLWKRRADTETPNA